MNVHNDQSPNDVWELFYDTPPNSEPIQGTNVTARSTNNECFIYESIFIIIATKSAIYFTNANNKFLNSDCSFNNCSSNTNGGSIYFKCNSSIVQYRTCSYKSKTNNQGHHSYVYLVSKSNNKNYLYESSFYECGNLEKSDTNYLWHGNIEVKSINTSFCKALYGSGIYLLYPTSLSNVTYSSICNTTSKNYILQLIWIEYNFNLCNVLNNEHIYSTYGTFYAVDSTVLIENCSFLGNIGPGKEFYQLFSGSITVKDSFCDRIIDKTYLCEAEFPILDLVIKKNIITKYEIVYHYSYHFITSLCIVLVNS